MKLFRCKHCGNVAMKVWDKGVPLVCCGEKMEELVPGVTDGALEKHVPVAEVNGNELIVKVGEVAHPMLDVHYITHIFAVMGQQVVFAELKPGEEPVAKFALGSYKGKVTVYEYCNLHGLWKTEIDV